MSFTDTATRIETIMDCYLRKGLTEGTMGKITPLRGGMFRVETSPCNKTVIVDLKAKQVEGFWSVSFKGMIGTDKDLWSAARMALEAGAGVSASKDVPVQLGAN